MPSKGSPPPAIEGSQARYYNNYVYIVAGEALFSTTDQYPNGFFRYSLLTNTWEDISNTQHSYIPRYYSGSAVIGGYLYLIYGWSDNLSEDISDIMRVNLNSSDFAWEEVTSSSLFVRDSFATAVKGNLIYLFSGYIASTSSNLNELVVLDISNLQFQVMSSDGLYPTSRSAPSMNLVNGLGYLFAGQGISSVFYNDMWIYDLNSEYWESVTQYGSIPTTRYMHAADAQGNAIAVWGGENAEGLLDDLYIYNSLTSYWTQLVPIGINAPAAAQGACLVMKMPLIYIFGGNSGNGALGQLWTYDIGSNEYSLISDTGPELAFMTCQLIEGEFYVLFGESSAQVPSNSISLYNFSTGMWEYMYYTESTADSSSRGVQIMIDGIAIRIAGEVWGLNPVNSVFLFDGTNQYFLGTVPDVIYSSGYLYYQQSLYIFGGSTAMGKALRLRVPSGLFIRIDLTEICANGLCSALCSPGTISLASNCEDSPSGRYAEGFGNTQSLPCPAGTFNPNSGGTSSRQCYPCPEGYFSSAEGGSLCLQCPNNFECPIGSIEPTMEPQTSASSSIQPGLYITSDSSAITLQYEIAITIITIIIILLSIFWARIRGKIKFLDLFQNLHNYELRTPMILDKNTIGGIFSLLFFGIALGITGISLITYQVSNIQETKGLVPLVILQSQVSNFVADEIYIYSTFLKYGASCESKDICNSLISVAVTNVRSSSFSFTCQLTADKSCIISIVCRNCIIDTGASVSIVLQEPLSYASGLFVNITSASSIPGTPSTSLQMLYPESGYMFIGPEASEVYFTMIPSLFTSQSSNWPRQATGYHVSTEQSPVVGSQYSTIDLAIVSQLKLIIVLDQSLSALYTSRTLQNTLILMFSAIVGSVFGFMQIVGGAMQFVEGNIIDRRKAMDYHKEMSSLRFNRKHLKSAMNIKKFDIIDRKQMSIDKTAEEKDPSLMDRNSSLREKTLIMGF